MDPPRAAIFTPSRNPVLELQFRGKQPHSVSSVRTVRHRARGLWRHNRARRLVCVILPPILATCYMHSPNAHHPPRKRKMSEHKRDATTGLFAVEGGSPVPEVCIEEALPTTPHFGRPSGAGPPCNSEVLPMFPSVEGRTAVLPAV